MANRLSFRAPALLGAALALAGCEHRSSPEVVQPTMAPVPTAATPATSTAPEAAAPATATTAPVKAQARGCDLEVTLTPDKTRFVLGEPVFMTFRVTTSCAKKLSVIDGGDYRNQFGRADSYKVGAVSATGAPVSPLDVGMGFGGLMGPRPLETGKPFEKRLLIAHWITFPAADGYTLTVEKELFIGEAMTPDASDKSQVKVLVAARVDVLPSSSDAIGAVIESLGKQLFASDDVAANEATQALTMTKDDRVVPYFAKLIESLNQSLRIYGVWGLRPYGTDDALAALKKALTIHELHLAAAQTLADNPHAKAWDTLWALRSDPDENVRLTALHALAKKNFPDEIARLQSFTKDASAMVSGEAKRYLRERKK